MDWPRIFSEINLAFRRMARTPELPDTSEVLQKFILLTCRCLGRGGSAEMPLASADMFTFRLPAEYQVQLRRAVSASTIGSAIKG